LPAEGIRTPPPWDISTGTAKVPPEKTPLAANAEPAAATLRKFRLDDVVMV
jgi:hypothetical protein